MEGGNKRLDCCVGREWQIEPILKNVMFLKKIKGTALFDGNVPNWSFAKWACSGVRRRNRSLKNPVIFRVGSVQDRWKSPIGKTPVTKVDPGWRGEGRA